MRVGPAEVQLAGQGDARHQHGDPDQDAELRMPEVRADDATEPDPGERRGEQQAVADVLVQRHGGVQLHVVRGCQHRAAEQQRQQDPPPPLPGHGHAQIRHLAHPVPPDVEDCANSCDRKRETGPPRTDLQQVQETVGAGGAGRRRGPDPHHASAPATRSAPTRHAPVRTGSNTARESAGQPRPGNAASTASATTVGTNSSDAYFTVTTRASTGAASRQVTRAVRLPSPDHDPGCEREQEDGCRVVRREIAHEDRRGRRRNRRAARPAR